MGKIPVGYENFDIFTPETKKFIIKAFYQKRKRWFVVLISPLVVIGLIFANSFFVKADLAFYYSPLCLGGWKNVKNIEGEPQVPSGSDLSVFTYENSATLRDMSGQIYCGRFQSGNPPEKEIKKVTLRFSLGVQEKPQEMTPTDFETGGTLDLNPNENLNFIFSLPANPASGSSETITPEAMPSPTELPGLLPESLESSPAPTPSESSIISPPPTGEPAPTTTPESTPDSTSSPQAEQVVPPTEIPSLSPSPVVEIRKTRIFGAGEATGSSNFHYGASPETFFWNFVFPRYAHAAEEPADTLSLDDMLEVSYTKDGENWIPLGKITRNNWQNISFEIPVSTVEEIENLQIAISSLPTLEKETTIYLDSIWLEAEYESGVVSFVKDIGTAILETVTLQNLVENATPVPTPTPTPKITKIEVYHFKAGESEKISGELPWYPREGLAKLQGFSDRKQKRNITVSVENDSQNLMIEGACDAKYYVILLYRGKDDYAQNPAAAVYNSAFPCDGAINHELGVGSINIPGGDYYLLVGEQGATGTWWPISDVRKINLEISEKEIIE